MARQAGGALHSTREVIIKNERFAEAKAFYDGVFGFTRILDDDSIVGFETGSFALFVEPGTPCGSIFKIECDDVTASAASFLLAGCIIVEDDPFGLTFNLRAKD